MRNLNSLIDELTKSGKLDLFTAEQIREAAFREIGRDAELMRSCEIIIDAIRNDCKDDAHKDERGHSLVLMNHTAPAHEYFTRHFKSLFDDIVDAIDRKNGIYNN